MTSTLHICVIMLWRLRAGSEFISVCFARRSIWNSLLRMMFPSFWNTGEGGTCHTNCQFVTLAARTLPLSLTGRRGWLVLRGGTLGGRSGVTAARLRLFCYGWAFHASGTHRHGAATGTLLPTVWSRQRPTGVCMNRWIWRPSGRSSWWWSPAAHNFIIGRWWCIA